MKYLYYPGCSLEGTAKEYNLSTQAFMKAVGAELVEIEDWVCCGASAAEATSQLLSLALPAMNLAIAENMEGSEDILVPCSACYLNLKKVEEKTRKDPELLEKINTVIQEKNLRLKGGGARTRHLLDVISKDIGPEEIRSRVKQKLSNLSIAPYYGCQLNRPWADIDDAHNPVLMDGLIRAVGAKPLENYSAKTECCGAAQMVAYKELCVPLNRRIVKDAVNKGANAICTVCPLCQLNVDSSQAGLGLPKIPVIFFTQLMGLAFGLTEEDLMLNKLLTPFKTAV